MVQDPGNLYPPYYRSATALVAEDFGGEGLESCALLPGIRGQARFAAGLLEKGCAVPSVLDGNLRQQQAAATVQAEEQAVAADFDGIGLNRLRGRENA